MINNYSLNFNDRLNQEKFNNDYEGYCETIISSFKDQNELFVSYISEIESKEKENLKIAGE